MKVEFLEHNETHAHEKSTLSGCLYKFSWPYGFIFWI